MNLLSLSARHNIVIPSGCRTGICGSCTAEIYVPGWKSETDGSSKDDWQLIRCCSAGAVDVCDGEIVVDLRGVARSPSTSTSTSIQLGEGEGEQEREPNNDPLARFSANWENEYVPDYMNEKKARKDLRSANVIDESIGVMGVLQPPWEYVPGGGANANANEKSTKTTYKSKSNDDLTEKEKVEAEIYLDKGRQVKRSCRTGICGSCTAEIYVPGWKSETDGSSKDDWQLIRCCSAGAVDVCDGEIVVDLRGVARSPSTSTSTSIQLGEGEGEQEREPNNDPLARFSANWENEYVPDYMNEKKARKDLRSANVIDESIGVMGVLQPPWEYVPGGGANANANEKSTKTTYKSKSNDDLTEKEKVEAEIYLDKGRQVKRKKRRDLNSISNPAPPRGARGGEAPWEKIW